MNILLNTLGIQDSGGITVLKKLLEEIKNSNYNFFIFCNENNNIEKVIEEFFYSGNLNFIIIKEKGFLYRLYYENIIFRKIIKENKIKLVYNFSATAQFFLPINQIVKVHNLMFYSKRLNSFYFKKKDYIKWMKQIFFKRFVFKSMLKQTKYIEVQSSHVKEYINDFIDIKQKNFFIKSDINISNNLFLKPKYYNFTKKLKFLYIVGPHFSYPHKNFEDFVNVMKILKDSNFNFEIIITLTKEQVHDSFLWDKTLDINTRFLGYIPNEELNNYFLDNTILISTSVIETLGLHVIEATRNGILSISPNEKYSRSVYGRESLTYELFYKKTLLETINKIILLKNNDIKDIILKNQNYLISNEKQKYNSIIKVFDEILNPL